MPTIRQYLLALTLTILSSKTIHSEQYATSSPNLEKRNTLTNRPIITLEEHFVSTASIASPGFFKEFGPTFNATPGLYEQLIDLGPKRLTNMDTGNITIQVISHLHTDSTPAECRAANDQLATAVRAHPTRFVGFAQLAMNEPEEAAKEINRTCSGGMEGGIKFVGALVNSHTNSGVYYEGPEYDVVWAEAVKLNVPIYIHPTVFTEAQQQAFASQVLSEGMLMGILGKGLGWHADVGMHIIRLYAGGVFDRYPELKIVIGHMGDIVPYMLERIEGVTLGWGRKRSFREVWDSNIWITTSGNWALDPMACILRNTKIDRIMFSVDYPFSKISDASDWLTALEESGMVSEEELEGIRWKNAARLLGLDVAAT